MVLDAILRREKATYKLTDDTLTVLSNKLLVFGITINRVNNEILLSKLEFHRFASKINASKILSKNIYESSDR